MQTFADWVQFSVAAAVVVLFLCIIVLLLVLILKRRQQAGGEKMSLEHLNKTWEDNADVLKSILLKPEELKTLLKERSKEEKEKLKSKEQRKRVFVMDFDGDLAASQCEALREQITTLISLLRPQDEVVVRIESPGGLVHSYGLASSQLSRLRDRNIKVTACVDKVAASGGYMMACVADRIVAAPFAVVGSIGVVAGIPNLNRFLKKHDIDYVEQTAGESKRTISLFGELTEEKKAKQQQQLNLIHDLFKKHIAHFRPQVDISKVSTGEVWPASEAMNLALVDELKTSDDLLLSLARDADVYLLKSEEKQDFKTKIMKKFFAHFGRLSFCIALVLLTACKVAPETNNSRALARLSSCALDTFKALEKNWPSTTLNPSDFETALEFDCKEASKINSLREPVSTANSAMENINQLVAKVPNGFVKDSVTILKPYCRNDNDLYGPFCMAADIDAAAELSEDTELTLLIPQAVHALGQEIAGANEIDFYKTLSRVLPANLENRTRRVALLAGFLGLDDNAVQADRLKANLLKLKRLDDYAKVFPALTQYAIFPPQNQNDYSRDFLAVLFATRTGVATLPGVAEGESQTYKAYAGFHLGCRMAILKRTSALAETEAYSMGYAYQMTKLGARLRKPLRQLLADAKTLDAHGRNTGEKMKAGARHGFTVCSGTM
ncbi:MAG: hypothetical protein RIR26_165 [Pseudomonadota bacterium]